MHKRQFLAALIVAAFLSLTLQAEGSAFILTYHTFLGTKTSGLDYSETEMGALLDRMSGLGYKFVSMADAMAGRIEGKANIIITIDDGNHSVYHAVKAVFEPRGIKPLLFVYAGIINQRWFAIKSSQLLELMADGCEVGVHGWYHEYMSETAWKKNKEKVLMEASRSGPALARIIGHQPKLFAYPFGVESAPAREALVKAGYEWLFVANYQYSPVNLADPALDRLSIPRSLTYRGDQHKLFAALEANLKS